MRYVSVLGMIRQAIPESTMTFSCVLGIRQRRQTMRIEVLNEPTFICRRILRPKSVANSVWIACVCEVRPSGHELLREMLLLRIERVYYTGRGWATMPEREQILDVSRVICQGYKSGHCREVERCRLVIEFIDKERYLGGQDFIDATFSAYSRVSPRSIPGLLRCWISRR
jgi:hypothetical protein